MNNIASRPLFSIWKDEGRNSGGEQLISFKVKKFVKQWLCIDTIPLIALVMLNEKRVCRYNQLSMSWEVIRKTPTKHNLLSRLQLIIHFVVRQSWCQNSKSRRISGNMTWCWLANSNVDQHAHGSTGLELLCDHHGTNILSRNLCVYHEMGMHCTAIAIKEVAGIKWWHGVSSSISSLMPAGKTLVEGRLIVLRTSHVSVLFVCNMDCNSSTVLSACLLH